MATITKDGYTYNTETKTRTSPTGKVVSIENMDAITPNLKADTPISLDSLNQTNQLSLPEAKPEVSPTYTLTPLETFERDTQMRAEASDKNYLDTQRAIGEAEAREIDYQEELGASANLKAFKNYERQLQAEQLALRRYKEDISGETSMSEEMTNATINQEEARSLRKQADIAILGNMALGNYNEAIQTAKTKVEMELKPLTRQLDYYKTVMERNQDLLSTTQKSKLQSLYSDIERQKNKEEERLTKGNEMIINAIQGGASQGTITKANDVLNNGGTQQDVANILGNYSISLSERLDINLKQAQLSKLKTDDYTDSAPVIKSIDGKDMQWDSKKGEWVKPTTTAGGGGSDTIQSYNDSQKIKILDNLIKNEGGMGLKASAGVRQLGKLLPPGFVNEIMDWRADVVSIASKLTMDNIVQLKGEGATFGALSDSERIAIGQAASSLMTSAVMDKNNNPTGRFRMSEKKVLEELKTIQDGYKKSFSLKYGISPEEYSEMQNPDTFWSALDSGTLQTNYGGYPLN